MNINWNLAQLETGLPDDCSDEKLKLCTSPLEQNSLHCDALEIWHPIV